MAPDVIDGGMTGPAVSFEQVHGDQVSDPSARRRTFRNDRLQEAFRSEGFVQTPFLDRRTIADLAVVCQSVGPAPGDPQNGFFPGNNSTSPEWKREVVRRVKPIVQDALDHLCLDHHVYHATFLTKWPGPEGFLEVHQDPSMVDEEHRFSGATLWCPLVVGEPDEYGMLRVVPRSHELSIGHWYRGLGHVKPVLEDVEGAIYDEFGVSLTPELGEAIVFDHRLLHYSLPNLTDGPRHVLALGLRPREASSVHVECDPDGYTNFYRVDDEFFIINPPVGQVAAAGYPLLRRVRREEPGRVNLDQLERVVGGSTRTTAAPPSPREADDGGRPGPFRQSPSPRTSWRRRASGSLSRLRPRARAFRDPA